MDRERGGTYDGGCLILSIGRNDITDPVSASGPLRRYDGGLT